MVVVISSCVCFGSTIKFPRHQECLMLSVLGGLIWREVHGEISQNGRPPFWFYRESIQITDEKHTKTMVIRTCEGENESICLSSPRQIVHFIPVTQIAHNTKVKHSEMAHHVLTCNLFKYVS